VGGFSASHCPANAQAALFKTMKKEEDFLWKIRGCRHYRRGQCWFKDALKQSAFR